MSFGTISVESTSSAASAKRRKRRLLRRFARTLPKRERTRVWVPCMWRSGATRRLKIFCYGPLQLRPFWARPHYDLGQVYMRLGEREKGREVLERFARLEEEEKMIKSLEFTLLSEAEDARRHYDLGVLYGQRRQFAKACCPLSPRS